MSLNTAQTLFNPRLLIILCLGFSSGLPIALTSSTLQAWFTEANIDLVTIGSLSLLGLPYALKFLWAPLMDHYRLPFGKRRGWMLLTQLCLVLSLLFIARMNPSVQATQMGILALIIAIFSASQDIAIDAYRTDVLQPEERGLGASYFVFTYRVATLISGGLALVFADYIGWQLTYEIMALVVLLSMVPTWFSPGVTEFISPPHFKQTLIAAMRDLFLREKILLLLLLVIFYKLGDALALSLMTNFLLHGLGFSLKEVGLAYKGVSFIAIILGAFVGGSLLVRWQLFSGLLVFGLAQAFSNLSFVLLAMIGKSFWFMVFAIFVENFCSGLSTAAFFAFLMMLCNQRFSASQFALLSAIASIGRVFLGPVAAVMVNQMGWVLFYIWAFILCFPGIIFLLLLKERVLNYAPATAN